MRFGFMILAVFALVVVVACGGGADDGGTSPNANLPAPPEPTGVAVIQLTGQGFADGGMIPAAVSCDGTGRSPTILWHDIPNNTKAIVVLLTDPDAGNYVHWLVYDVPRGEPGLTSGIGSENTLADGAHQGKNSAGLTGYGGPCPPTGTTHRYEFHVYALDLQLGQGPGATVDQVTAAMSGHILAQGKLTASYSRLQPTN